MNKHLFRRWNLIILFVLFPLIHCSAVQQAVSNLISACGDLSFDQIQQQNDISDSCRSAIDSLLPDNQNNFSSKLLALGNEIDATTNQPKLYIQGADGSGNALSTTDFENAVITVTENGTETTLDADDFEVTSLENASTDLLSIYVVTDYSGSMSDTDLDTVALIYNDVFTVLPSIYEAAANVFTDTVTEIQDFTQDQSTILSALARNDSIDRSSTSLYDGMGSGLASLTSRSRPIRLLIVSTDGLENSSETYSKSQITSTISTDKIFVVMIGSLLSDVSELEDLAGSRGIFFYAQSYTQARTAITEFVESLGKLVMITVDNAYQNASSIQVTADSVSTTFSF